MTTTAARTQVANMIDRLRKDFPHPRYELNFETPVQLLVATIMAANSTDEGVNKITADLFEHLPDAAAFAAVDLGVLEDAIRSCGLAKQKAKAIKSTCQLLVEHYGGEVPKDMDVLVQFNGVGRKTANVVLQTAYGMVTGVIVDTHVSRVARRVGLTVLEEADAIEQELMAIVPRDQWSFFGPALVLHGRRVCQAKRPRCDECSIRSVCQRVGVET